MKRKDGFSFESLISFEKNIPADTLFEGFIIKPVMETYDGDNISVTTTQTCKREDATAFAVYITTAGNGLQWVADLETETEAKDFLYMIKRIINIVHPQPVIINPEFAADLKNERLKTGLYSYPVTVDETCSSPQNFEMCIYAAGGTTEPLARYQYESLADALEDLRTAAHIHDLQFDTN